MFGMHQRFLGVFGVGKAAPDEHVDFASVKPSFGMPCVDASNLQDGIGRRSGGTSGALLAGMSLWRLARIGYQMFRWS